MAGISFRDRQYRRHMDASFYLGSRGSSGPIVGNVSHWHIGDTVAVCFPGQRELITQVCRNCPHGFDFPNGGDLLQVLCTVVKRSHSIVWESVGRFDELTTCSVTLEAESGYWEDVLKWVILGQKPAWVSEDE
jgi:hypothetical protein